MKTKAVAVRKRSSYSGNNGNCVEIADDADALLVRDSSDAHLLGRLRGGCAGRPDRPVTPGRPPPSRRNPSG
ncbi:DUF397 domain-containing protein [Streptomyces sp. RFCAC02]|uniref:DUF397 domain-containing protein n=1 Tax=Streptomyces sp. RFCAC02 TaxID=2499143 RepID=UPI00102110A6|nr:DUF397 domain-containing protein [Streptomyces sp. RFCAC02]